MSARRYLFVIKITFCVSGRRAKCILVTRFCLSVRGRMPTLLHGPKCNLGNGRGCPLVVHCWADLQWVHGLRCCDNIAQMQNISVYMLVLAQCLVPYVNNIITMHTTSTSTRWHFAFALCCHSNETRVPIANPPNSAQLGDTPTIFQVTSWSVQ